MSESGSAGNPRGRDDGAGGESDDGFAALGLRPELVRVLAALGYEEPTPIQREAIPPLLEGRDLLGQAATGTGKTAAFALPLLHRLAGAGRAGDALGDEPFALVLVPTRELAVQVSEAIHRYGRDLGARVLPIYGGAPIGRQLRALADGVDVVVATPGRALDHLNRGTLHLDALSAVVLDEADEMLDMGFAEELDAILEATPDSRQTLLFSATMPRRIEDIASRHLRDAQRILIGAAAETPGTAPKVRQRAYLVHRAHKAATLGRILDLEAPTAALVFCRTRDEVDTLAETLNARGYRAEALHGGISQDQRERVMGRLRAGTADLVVATDVAARGIDVEQLTHVVNYDVPSASEAYVHRIGRVGRAGREGVAITLMEPREHRLLKSFERAAGQRIALETVPTVADLRARRLELTRSAVAEALADGEDLAQYRVVVEALSSEYDVMDVALAAVRVAHEASTGAVDDDADIPQVRLPERSDKPGTAARSDRGGRPGRAPGGRDEAPERRGSRGQGRGHDDGGTVKLFVGAGRAAGVRPQDLVGAITGESDLRGRDVGAIDITDRFSLVEVPEGAAEDVIQALRATTIKGRKVTVRRDRGGNNR